MSEIINNWVKEHGRDEGVLALGVRYSAKLGFSASNAPEFPVPAVDNALRGLADAFAVLNVKRLPTGRLRWVYGNAVLHAAMRTDGACLGIFARKEPPTLEPDRVESLVAEFQTLPA